MAKSKRGKAKKPPTAKPALSEFDKTQTLHDNSPDVATTPRPRRYTSAKVAPSVPPIKTRGVNKDSHPGLVDRGAVRRTQAEIAAARALEAQEEQEATDDFQARLKKIAVREAELDQEDEEIVRTLRQYRERGMRSWARLVVQSRSCLTLALCR